MEVFGEIFFYRHAAHMP